MSKDYSLTISRNSRDEVCVQVSDNISRVRFLELSLTLEEYAQVITGLGSVPVSGEVKGLEFVGKKKIVELRTVQVPEEFRFKTKEASEWIKDNCKEDGWLIDAYLGSKGSFSGGVANYKVYKYVEVFDE